MTMQDIQFFSPFSTENENYSHISVKMRPKFVDSILNSYHLQNAYLFVVLNYQSELKNISLKEVTLVTNCKCVFFRIKT